MSSDPRVLGGAPPAPPFSVVRAAHAELLATDLDRAGEFYVAQLGFVVSERTEDALYLRAYEDRHHHCLALRRASRAAVGHLAFLVASDEDVDRAAAHYRGLGRPVRPLEQGEEPGQGRSVRVLDPLGFPVEFFAGMAKTECLLQQYHLHRGGRVQRIDHFNLHVPDVRAGFRYYGGLGFRCSEYIAGDGPEPALYAAWLFRKPTVHDVALTAGRGPRLHHLGFTAADTDAIHNLCDALGGSRWHHSIERGPGRHGVSNAFYLYLRDPDGHRVELYTGDYWTGDPDLEPKRWSVTDDQRRSYWGHEVPERWYRESSELLDLDGRPLPLTDPPAQEQARPLVPR